MPYISRDANNNIIGLFTLKQTDNQEFLADDSLEFKTYNENKAKVAHNADIQAQITTLETTQARAIREMLTSPNDFAKNKLLDIDNQIAELRKQLL